MELGADHPLALLRQPKDLHPSDNAVDGSPAARRRGEAARVERARREAIVPFARVIGNVYGRLIRVQPSDGVWRSGARFDWPRGPTSN
jgi:hypothetical protein